MENNRRLFEEKAEKLAKVEGMILTLADYSPENPANFHKKTVRPIQVYIWLGIAAVGGILSFLLWDGGVICLVLGVVCLAGVLKAYLEWNNYRASHKEEKESSALAKQAAQLEKQRKQLVEELNQMQAQEPSLAGNYWWHLHKNPAFEAKMVPGRVPNYNQWQYGLLCPVYLTDDQNGIYLENMKTYTLLVSGNELREMLTHSGIPQVTLYCNDDLLNASCYKIMKLYAYASEPVQEIVSSTACTRIDKERLMEACRRKLDQREIFFNTLGDGTAVTNQEMYERGLRNESEHGEDAWYRSMLEMQEADKINAQGDYEEQTSYRKIFRNLYRYTFLQCADVYLSVEENTNGTAVAVTVPRTPQSLMHIMVRTPNEDEFCGYLESYGGQDAVMDGEVVGKVSIQMAADILMNDSMRRMLNLRKRDVLAPRPEGLDDYEWAYLIWKDQ